MVKIKTVILTKEDSLHQLKGRSQDRMKINKVDTFKSNHDHKEYQDRVDTLDRKNKIRDSPPQETIKKTLKQTTGTWKQDAITLIRLLFRTRPGMGQRSRPRPGPKARTGTGTQTADIVDTENNEIKIIYISYRKLTDAEISLLNKGLKFTPTPRLGNAQKLIEDLNGFNRKLRLAEFFDGTKNEDTSLVKNKLNLLPQTNVMKPLTNLLKQLKYFMPK